MLGLVYPAADKAVGRSSTGVSEGLDEKSGRQASRAVDALRASFA